MTAVRTIFRDNIHLFRLIARFHASPSRLVHPDRWPEEVPEAIRQLLHSRPAGEKWLMRWMAENWQIDPVFQYQFDLPRHRIALLEPHQFESLLWHCAAAIHANAVTHAIDRNSQSDYKDTLGEKAYRFALKRAGFLTRNLSPEWKSLWKSNGPIASSLAADGLQCLGICLTGAPPELCRRIQCSLPGSLTFPMERVQYDGFVDEVWQFVRRILLTEISPELGSCFN